MTERDEMAVLADELARDAATYAAGTPTRKLLHKAADALRSAARTDAGYGIKPLEWTRETATAHVPETWRARSIGREYDIQRTGDGKFDLWADAGTALTVEGSLEEAKAAAQADFEQRIRTAITATVGTAEPGFAEGVLLSVMNQAESDLKSAHAEICKLQGLDPATHDWPEWSPQATTLRWFATIRDRITASRSTFDPERKP